MTRSPLPFLVLAVLFFVGNVSGEDNRSDVTSRESLFNGVNLEGWEGNPKYWRVEDGAIVGEIPVGKSLEKNTWLIWRNGELHDFDLQLDFKLSGDASANSGIQFRCQADSIDHVSGYQADLDMGQEWLGRIYDEHGRGLISERGTRVRILPDGSKKSEVFAPSNQYAVLFRENAWNQYRIVAVGEHIQVFINGTLFSELEDQQINQRDLNGALAFQLHSGPPTRVAIRNVTLQNLQIKSDRLEPFKFKSTQGEVNDQVGEVPGGENNTALNLGFESGNLSDWTATGSAFERQPIDKDSIPDRWAGQNSGKNGNFFIGGFEVVQDAGVGTLTSSPFKVTKPYASFLVGGGSTESTRVEILLYESDEASKVIFAGSGHDREQMSRVAVDLREHQGKKIAVRIVDESSEGWGHVNFDDFRFHDSPPTAPVNVQYWRTTANPLLQHLVENPVGLSKDQRGTETTAKMFVPQGFSVDVVAAEPQVHQPMAFTFDAKGRLWVVEGYSYPQKRPEGEGLDRVVIFSDDDGDGRFENRKVFIEGLNLVSGMEVGHGGVWIGAAPQLLFIPDRNGDDVPDSAPEILLDGFGFADTHETLNSFMWGPDGWLYGNQGVFNSSQIGKPGAQDSERTSLAAGVWRYHPTRHQFEVFAHGGSNQWGLDYDQHGQIFMTHCRSFWGRGLTTHVMLGGHYWNQVNSGYARFISSESIATQPAMQNFLLASARYGHGEGGAGKAGSREVYGGHSHVGTMIYLGDNWPAEYRNHLFTHNLHGHQLNHQINQREAGGYNTIHAGSDVLFCGDEQYIGVDLKYGPDGAVYISDWYDPRHCHNPNVELWDRGNGRIYRMKYDATYKPTKVDYSSANNAELVAAQKHPNDWHARIARQVLSERATAGKIDQATRAELEKQAVDAKADTDRLKAIWSLHAIGAVDGSSLAKWMHDPSEYVRGWAVQIATETMPTEELSLSLVQLADKDESLFVRRCFASALQRISPEHGWKIASILSQQADNTTDRDLPLLLWYGIAGLMDKDLERGLELANKAQIEVITDFAAWYAAKLSTTGREQLTKKIAQANRGQKLHLLGLLELAVRGMRGVEAPVGWSDLAVELYDAEDLQVRQAAESLGATFGDEALFVRMRNVLSSKNATLAAKQHAISILRNDNSMSNQPVLLPLLGDPQVRLQVLPLLTRFDDIAIAKSVLNKFTTWSSDEKAAGMELLASRISWANAVLDAVAAGAIPKSELTAYYARQMSGLGDDRLNERIAKEWGSVRQSSSELKEEITKTLQAYKSAPLWAYSEKAGAVHFKQLCASCHQPVAGSENIAPNLAGTGSKGIDYIVENVIDPNAVIGQDFQARLVMTDDGRIFTGLVTNETDSAITLRTATTTETISKEEIEEMKVSPNSFMPMGLIGTLNDRERIELFKYMMEQ